MTLKGQVGVRESWEWWQGGGDTGRKAETRQELLVTCKMTGGGHSHRSFSCQIFMKHKIRTSTMKIRLAG